MNCRSRSHGGRWLVRMLGALLVVSTSHPVPVSGSNDDVVTTVGPEGSADHIAPEKVTSKLTGDLASVAAGEAGADPVVDVVAAYDSLDSALSEPSTGERQGGRYARLPFRAVRVSAAGLNALVANPHVRYVTRDSAVFGASQAARQAARVPGSPGLTYSSNVAYNGQGVTVAVVDTGVATHPDFYSLGGQFDFVNGAQGTPMAKVDGFGHGTHVAGMIGGTGSNSTSNKYQGVSTSAKIVGLRVLDANGRGVLSDVLRSLDWILTTGIPQHNIRVANLSLGKGVEGLQAQDPLVHAVDAVWDAGVVVVVSAGNHGDSGHYTITSPGNSRKVITVGSLSENGTGGISWDDRVSSFSSRGPTLFDHVLKPDLLAPGNRIMAPYAEGSTIGTLVTSDRIVCGNSCGNRYLRLSGTSMAAGLVSGAAARMLQKDPSLTPATVKARLMKTARKLNGDPTNVGAGLMDVEAAMNATGVMNVPALSPLMLLSPAGDLAYVQDTAQLWGSSQWSASYLWADGFLWTNAAPLGVNGFLWSNSYLWSNSALWANSFLWTNGFLWTDSVKPASIDVEDESEEVVE